MKLVAEWVPYRCRLRRPFATARGVLRERCGWILTVKDDDGCRGRGEAAPLYWMGGPSLDAVAAVVANYAGAAGALEVELFESGGDIAAWIDTLAGKQNQQEPVVRAALETALVDWCARRRGIAVAKFLAVNAATEISVNALVSATDPRDVETEAAESVKAGARCLKLKVAALTPESDLARIAAAQRGAGGRGTLRLDANCGWDFETAQGVLTRIDPAGIEYVEEPLMNPDTSEYRRLKDATSHCLAVDESLDGLGGVDTLAANGCCDVVVLKPARVGGPLSSLKIASTARSYGLRVVLTDAIETLVGQAAVVHAAAALGDGLGAIVGLGGRLLEDRTSRRESGRGVEVNFSISVCGPGLSVRAQAAGGGGTYGGA